MAKRSSALHHLTVRKRIHVNHEIYPSKDKVKRVVDKIIYAVGIASVLISIPQLLEIWVGQNASGVSTTSWALWVLTDILWLTYGYLHKIKPIIIAYALAIITDILVVIGSIIYG
jgi:uncharacterized protein with PQ loop repeat